MPISLNVYSGGEYKMRAPWSISNRGKSRLNVALGKALLLLLIGCRPSSPTGEQYLGKWNVQYDFGEFARGSCVLDITRVGESFLMTNECTGGTGRDVFAGVFTSTPEGNLRGGLNNGLTIVYDDATGRAIASGVGQIQYLTRAQH
jgi:hypothetical protein